VANTVLILGLAGIGGTAFAAVATSYVNVLLDARRAERESREREQITERAERKAARLVEDELQESLSMIDNALEENVTPNRSLSADEWTEHKSTLAEVIADTHDWEALVFAYYSLRILVQLPPPARQPLNEATRRLLEPTGENIRKALVVLSKVTGGSPILRDSSDASGQEPEAASEDERPK